MKHNRAGFILIPVLICALLFAVIPSALILTGHAELIRGAVNTVFVPIERVFSGAGDGVRSMLAYFTEFDELKAENERLRAQLASMEDKVRAAELTLEENAFLTNFLDLRENHADFRFLKCEVVAADDNGYRTVYTLNAGTKEGAAAGNPVITAEGLLGRISEVGSNWCKVVPVTELSSSVGAYAERSGAGGIAEGEYALRMDGKLLLTYLEENADVVVGDRIRTSGVNSIFPRGLLIGEVTELRTDPANMARTAVITPAVRFGVLRDVMIITDFAHYEEIPDEILNPSAADTTDTN